MSEKSGFFDAIQSGLTYDRVYSAADYCDNLATIIKNGVRYSAANDLAVTPNGGLNLAVAPGRAWLEGHYYYNDAINTSLTLDTAPTGTQVRIDLIVVRLDTSVPVRAAQLAIVKGTPSNDPVAPSLTRAGSIYEIQLAAITIPAGTTDITSAMIEDTRGDDTVCGWAASVTPAIMSMLRSYMQTETLTAPTSTVTITLPEYDAADVHILDVYTNGIRDVAGDDYTVAGNTITFTDQRTAGAQITIVLYKSIDGTGLESVADEVDDLVAYMAATEKITDYYYVCTGTDDNVAISQIAQAFFAGAAARMTLHVVGGNLGMTTPAAGSGTSASPYAWFNLGSSSASTRRLTVDFANAGKIELPALSSGKYYNVFKGANVIVENATVSISSSSTPVLTIFDGAGNIGGINCDIDMTLATSGAIAKHGRYINCRGRVTNTAVGASHCFNSTASGLIEIEGGEYLAYAKSSSTGSVVSISLSTAAAVLRGVNMPTISKTGYTQTYASKATAGAVKLIGCVTALPDDGSYTERVACVERSFPNV